MKAEHFNAALGSIKKHVAMDSSTDLLRAMLPELHLLDFGQAEIIARISHNIDCFIDCEDDDHLSTHSTTCEACLNSSEQAKNDIVRIIDGYLAEEYIDPKLYATYNYNNPGEGISVMLYIENQTLKVHKTHHHPVITELDAYAKQMGPTENFSTVHPPQQIESYQLSTEKPPVGVFFTLDFNSPSSTA